MKKIFLFILSGMMISFSCGGGEKKTVVTDSTQVYIVGGGIAGLSAVVAALRDGHVQGKNIYILEELQVMGGVMDGKGTPKEGYASRGARLINEEAYKCYFDILSGVPSLKDQEEMEKQGFKVETPLDYKPEKTLKDEIFAFNETHLLHASTLR